MGNPGFNTAEHHRSIMKTSLFNSCFVALFMACFAVSTATAAHKKSDPIEQARHHLEQAHNLLTKKEEGVAAKKGADISSIISVLIEAETSLNDTKNNKGSNISVALKLVGDAKAELESAKGGGQEDAHLSKADGIVQDALKHVMQAVRVHGAKS
jgi:hypothetical protein